MQEKNWFILFIGENKELRRDLLLRARMCKMQGGSDHIFYFIKRISADSKYVISRMQQLPQNVSINQYGQKGYKYVPLRIGAVGTHVVGLRSKGRLFRKPP